MKSDTTTPDEMRRHLKMWREVSDGMWERKGFHMHPVSTKDAYEEQLRINARMARRKELRGKRGAVYA